MSGYTHEWVSKKHFRNDPVFDFVLDHGEYQAKWNLNNAETKPGYSWLDDPFSVDEVGCIHTCQGLDLPYCGVILGKDIRYDKDLNKIVFDRQMNAKSDVASGIHYKTTSSDTAEKLIRNTYHVLLTRGMKGTYVYCEDENLREYLKSLIV